MNIKINDLEIVTDPSHRRPTLNFLKTMWNSIKETGLDNPITLVWYEKEGMNRKYLLASGRVRLLALTEIGKVEELTQDMVRLVKAFNRKEALVLASAIMVTENMHRIERDPLEIARAIYEGMKGQSIKAISRFTGKSEKWIVRHMSLETLSTMVRNAWYEQNKPCSVDHLIEFARYPIDFQERVMEDCHGILTHFNLKEFKERLAGMGLYPLVSTEENVLTWDLTESLPRSCHGACATCQFNTANAQPNLFTTNERKEQCCTNLFCFREHMLQRLNTELQENPDLDVNASWDVNRDKDFIGALKAITEEANGRTLYVDDGEWPHPHFVEHITESEPCKHNGCIKVDFTEMTIGHIVMPAESPDKKTNPDLDLTKPAEVLKAKEEKRELTIARKFLRTAADLIKDAIDSEKEIASWSHVRLLLVHVLNPYGNVVTEKEGKIGIDGAEFEQLIWAQFLHSASSTIKRTSSGPTTPDTNLAQAALLAIGIDPDETMRGVENATPIPKSWAKLQAEVKADKEEKE